MSRPLSAREIDQARGNDQIGTKLVAETGNMKIWHLRLAPGETIAAHRHDRPYFWTVLTDGKAKSRYGDGRIEDITYASGQTQHFPDLTPDNAFVHDLTNTGDAELVFVTIEFEC
ncbi:cupin domain-containing protein [Leisingera sp. ANG59]|uniref:cupin domain-containing protein n=1 Tax=Leisingera sp. ANG59 TaxID=2675221 RepID=UPI0015737356|nr:cupin domain-containing protein [Leisingera sp. ANG59]NSY40860.1 cupin domain-containing protein [Leisingera sp. ANG59]